MPTLCTEVSRSGSVTFVEALVETDRPYEVRLEWCFDGCVWPPRRDGTVSGAWDADGVTVETGRGATPVGFATPVATGENPIEIVHTEPRSVGRHAEVDAWLERMETRLVAAESLAAVEDLSMATEAVADIGGLTAVETLAGEIARDRRIAARSSVVPEELCRRLDDVEIPTEAFAALADGGQT